MTNPLIYEENTPAPLTAQRVDHAYQECRRRGALVTKMELAHNLAQGLWDSLAAEPRSLEPLKTDFSGPSFASIPLIVSSEAPEGTLTLLDRHGRVVGRIEGITL